MDVEATNCKRETRADPGDRAFQAIGQSTRVPVATIRRRDSDSPSNKQLVLETIHELYDQGLPVTRESIARATGLRMVSIDESLKSLKAQELIWAPERGVFRPVEMHPPARPISKTILPNGLVKLEIGDEVLTLTPKENRMLAELQAGAAAQLAAIEGSNALIQMAQLAQSMIASGDGRAREHRRAMLADEGQV